MTQRYSVLATCALLLAVLSLAACAPSQDVSTPAGFYRHNTLTIISPTGAGGGIDYTGRLVASYWGSKGYGTAIVLNQPDGGHVVGYNNIWNSEPDGLTIGNSMLGGEMLGMNLFGQEGARFNSAEFDYLVYMVDEPMGIGITSTIEPTVDALRALPQVIAATESAMATTGIAQPVFLDILARNAGCTDSRLVAGYDGSKEIALVLGKGEAHLTCQSLSTLVAYSPDYMEPFCSLATDLNEAYPDIPPVGKLFDLSDEHRQYVELLDILKADRVLFTPPGVPEDRLEYLRSALLDIVTDEAFVRQMKLRFPAWTTNHDWQQAQRNADRALNELPGDTVKAMSALVGKYLA